MAAIKGRWYVGEGPYEWPDKPTDMRYVYSNQPDGEKYIVAKVWAGDDGDYAGTAGLIAAAPAMLTALRAVRYFVWLVSVGGGSEPRRLLGLIDAALVAAGDDQPTPRGKEVSDE